MTPEQQAAMRQALEAIANSGDFLFNWHDCEPNNEREMSRYQCVLAMNEKAFNTIRTAIEAAEKQQPADENEWLTGCPECGMDGGCDCDSGTWNPRAANEPMAFQIFKPTPPRHAIPDVRDAELPWVYDQDLSSGNVASMWVTPVTRPHPSDEPVTCKRCGGTGVVDDGEIDCYENGTPFESGPVKCVKACPNCTRTQPAAQWQGLTGEEVDALDCVQLMWQDYESCEIHGVKAFARAIEAKLKEKNKF